MTKNGRRVLITGGAGFIGSNLVDYFLKKKFSVFVIDNFLTSSKKNIRLFLKKPNFYFLRQDLNKVDLSDKLKGQSFDIIYHLASPASPKQFIKYPIETSLVNSYATYKLLEYAKKKASVFVFASTSEVYGDPKAHPQSEDYWGNVNPTGERSCYDESKRFGESLCLTFFRKYGLDVRIARIFNTYGPNMEKDDGRVISNFIVQALSGDDITIYGDGRQTRSFCYVDDMVKALYLLGTKKPTEKLKGEIVNLGNDEEKKIIEIARLVKKLVQSDSKLVFEPLPKDDPQRRKPDLKKAKKLLLWQPKVPFNKGLVLTIEYFKNRFDL